MSESSALERLWLVQLICSLLWIPIQTSRRSISVYQTECVAADYSVICTTWLILHYLFSKVKVISFFVISAIVSPSPVLRRDTIASKLHICSYGVMILAIEFEDKSYIKLGWCSFRPLILYLPFNHSLCLKSRIIIMWNHLISFWQSQDVRKIK